MKNSRKSSSKHLRHQAEVRLSENAKKEISQPEENLDTLRLLHELQVHQIELEMQNDQLAQSQIEVDAALKHYADLYNDLYDFAPVGYFSLNRDGTIQRTNLTGVQLLGVERGRLIKRRLGSFVATKFRPEFNDFLARIFTNQGKESYEGALVKDNYELFWAHLEAAMEDNVRQECRVVMLDITERKQVEIELQKRKEELEIINMELGQSRMELQAALHQYNDLYDFAPVGYFTINRDGKILQTNQAGERLLGVEYERLVRQNIGTFVSPDSRATFNIFFDKLLKNKEKEICELELLTDGGKPIWVSVDASTFEGGSECRVVMINITERKRIEQALQESENRFRTTLQDVPTIAVQGYVMDGTTQYWNSASERLYGYSAQEAIGKNLLDLIIPPEMRSGVWDAVQQMAKTGEPIPAAELSLMRKDGSRVSVYSSHAVVSVPGREPELFCLDVDLTERKRIEDNLRASELKFRALAENIPSVIYQCRNDLQYTFLYLNTAIEGLTGYPPKAFLEDGLTFLDLCHPDDLSSMREPLDMESKMDHTSFHITYRIRHKSGEWRWVDEWGAVILDEQKAFEFIEGILVDITERKQADDELRQAKEALEAVNIELQSSLARQQQLAHTDALTGINNRRYLYELADREFEVATRYQKPLSVIMFDLDHFKDVNDTYGHAAGDRILQLVTQVACAELRSADVIGRYGGEEFVVILPMTSAQQAYSLAERIRAGVAAIRVPTEKGSASVTLSIGIVEMNQGGPHGSVEDLIRSADAVMYAAKQAGRNRTMIASED